MDELGLFRLRKEFPTSGVQVLKSIDKWLRQQKTSYIDPKIYRELQTKVDEHLFCLIECKGVFSTKLTAIQELQLIQIFCTYFEERKASKTPGEVGHSLLELVFFGVDLIPAIQDAHCDILAKTVSLTVQLRCTPFLNELATWMQKACLNPQQRSASSNQPTAPIPDGLKKITAQLIDHYCSFGPLPASDLLQHRRVQQQRIFLDLVTLCPSLPPYITAAAMNSYEFFAPPPTELLEILTEWICTQAALFWRPHKDASKYGTSATPFLKALAQGLGKLLCLCLVYPKGGKLSSLCSRLELGLLRLIEIAPKPKQKDDEENPNAVMTTLMVTDTLKYVQQKDQKDIQDASYALFRALQMCVSCGCFGGTKWELEQALAPYMSDYPFLQFVLNQY